jgi:hypothetical protein
MPERKPIDHAEVMNRCSDKALRVGLNRVSEAEITVVLVSWANFEIECGGFSQFFYNSAGDNAEETVEALEKVGASRAAAAMREAIALFPSQKVLKNRANRWAAWQKVEFTKEFDKEFSADKPDVFSRLCDYIESHSSELKEHCV